MVLDASLRMFNIYISTDFPATKERTLPTYTQAVSHLNSQNKSILASTHLPTYRNIQQGEWLNYISHFKLPVQELNPKSFVSKLKLFPRFISIILVISPPQFYLLFFQLSLRSSIISRIVRATAAIETVLFLDHRNILPLETSLLALNANFLE